jgi:hypothetical protein
MDDVQQSGSQAAPQAAVVTGQTEATGTTATVSTSGRVSDWSAPSSSVALR